MNISDIARMSKIQRLQTMEAIWDSLIHDATGIESPDWHGDILAARRDSIAEGKAEFFSIEELKARNKK
jgi:putative addiction module component (TIGR02574 family)